MSNPSPVLPLPATIKQRRYWSMPHGSAYALLLAQTAQAHPALLVALTHDSLHAAILEDELKIFAPDLSIVHLPDWETLPYDAFSPHPQLVSQRISTLYQLPRMKHGVLIVSVTTLMQRIAPLAYINGSGLQITRGQPFDLCHEQRRLEESGYRHVLQVNEPGEFATRGSVIDIFPMGSHQPYRIELLDDAIESIRSFDPETQRSKQHVERVELLPACEFPTSDQSRKQFRDQLRERFPIDVRHCPIYQDMKEGCTPGGIEYYLPLFFPASEPSQASHQHAPTKPDGMATLFDYLNNDALFVLAPDVNEASETFWKQTTERYEQRCHDIERPVLPPRDLYLPPESLRAHLNQCLCVQLVTGPHKHAIATTTKSAPALSLNRKHAEAGRALRHFLEQSPSHHVLLAADSAGRREILIDMLATEELKAESVDSWSDYLATARPSPSVLQHKPHDTEAKACHGNGLTLPRLAMTIAPLEQGFVLQQAAITVLTEYELFGQSARIARHKRRGTARDPNTIIRDLNELSEGAAIVHIEHGVGRYRGLLSMQTGDVEGEFLVIEYAKGDKLYVPVAQLALVSRYAGTTPELAPLHALGGNNWERTRHKAAQKAHDVAAELLAIYAQREARGGQALAIDLPLVQKFGEHFPFEETDDQKQAINAVLNDLSSPHAMDRLICGDVGFGKTEVALRAAFAAVTAGMQVAILVPTTLLAQQHYRNFSDRFADWPVKVEVLSRLRSKAEVETTLQRLANGRIDVIVGTHKLLQPSIRFQKLGLVIVDEEQRFGTRHKEQLKKLRAEVDLLTMTATPIPRTLNMAMSGLRDLSLITTPPAHRMAVRTFISNWDLRTISEALQRELQRGGQVYFLQNEVQAIARTVHDLQQLMPGARIGIAHGQMPARELETVMADFQRQRFNILVCTTIIETGIDIPNANTIIIDRADRFGLAQLHQLRGRVGRSHHRAYAYLIVPDQKRITVDAKKRLEALAALEELGSGFTLATHDLEIRGAGELLGDEQSGQIQAIGFNLYNELLERAVHALKSGQVPDFDLSCEHQSDVELHLPTLIPEDYLPDIHTRLTLYKRIASARTEDHLRELKVEMIERFGLLPEPARHLFALSSLRLMATPLGIRKLDFGEHGGRIVWSDTPHVDPGIIIKLIQTLPQVYKLEGQDKLHVMRTLPTADERIASARELLCILGTSPA